MARPKNVYTQVLRHGAATDTCDDAGVYLGTNNGELFYSPNGGDSWELLQSNLPPTISLHTAVI